MSVGRLSQSLKIPPASSSVAGVCWEAGLGDWHLGGSAGPRAGSANVAALPSPLREIRAAVTSLSNEK